MIDVGTSSNGDARAAALCAVRGARRVLVVRADDLGDNILGAGFLNALNDSIAGECGFVGTPLALELLDTRKLSFVAGVDCRPRDLRDVARVGIELRRQVDRFDPDVVLLPRFDFEREAVGIALLGFRPRTTITWARDATPKRARRNWWLRALPGPRLLASGAPHHELERLRFFADFVGVELSEKPAPLSPRVLERVVAAPELAGVTAPIVVVGVGAAQPRRWWPPDRFASVIGQLSELGYVSVLVGSKDERHLGEQVRRSLPSDVAVIDLIGKLGIEDTAAVVSRGVLYIGNDSGVGHIAAAVGTTTVTISCHPVGRASADHVNAPERYRPAGHGVVVRPAYPTSLRCANGCVPADRPCCITNIPADAVLAAVLAQLTGDEVAGSGRVEP